MSEPRLDVAELLAREAVALDRSPQTEGTLLSTLLRSPAVIGTFSLPTSSDAACRGQPRRQHAGRLGQRRGPGAVL